MRIWFLCALLGCASAQYVKTGGVKGGHVQTGHGYTGGEHLIRVTNTTYNSDHTQHAFGSYPNTTTGSTNYETGICYTEVPTASLVHGQTHVPAGNGSRPELSRVRTCCKGYIRNIYNYKICDPVCAEECVNSLCSAPNTCTCYPDYVKNKAGLCVPTCPIGCQNGQCVGGECICNNGYILDSESKYCFPAGSAGECVSPDMCRYPANTQSHNNPSNQTSGPNYPYPQPTTNYNNQGDRHNNPSNYPYPNQDTNRPNTYPMNPGQSYPSHQNHYPQNQPNYPNQYPYGPNTNQDYNPNYPLNQGPSSNTSNQNGYPNYQNPHRPNTNQDYNPNYPLNQGPSNNTSNQNGYPNYQNPHRPNTNQDYNPNYPLNQGPSNNTSNQNGYPNYPYQNPHYPNTNQGYNPNYPPNQGSSNNPSNQDYNSGYPYPSNQNHPNEPYYSNHYPNQPNYPTSGSQVSNQGTYNVYPSLNQMPSNEGSVCSQSCLNGFCVEGNRCSCYTGYVLDNTDPTGTRCLPDCPAGCPNGICSAPNFCTCNPGYFKDTSVKGRAGCVKRIRRSPQNMAELLTFKIPDDN